MANFKISQLTQIANIDPNASLLIVQNGKNYRITVKQLLSGYSPDPYDPIDLSNYYTKDEVNNIISILNASVLEIQTNLNSIDLTQFYTKNEVDSKIIDLEASIEQTIIEIVNSNSGTSEEANTQFDSIFSV